MDFNWAIIIVLVLTLAGCQSTISQESQAAITPAWVNTPPKPSGALLYGVGSVPLLANEAQAKQAAEEAARAELARQIRIVVDAQTDLQQTATEQGMAFEFAELIKNRVPAMELTGVQVEALHTDWLTNTVYALVSFNKLNAIAELQQQIAALDLQTLEIDLESSPQHQPTSISRALSVKKLIAQRQQFNAQLENLSSPRALRSALIYEQVRRADTLLDTLSFAVKTDSDNDVIHSGIIKLLNDQGIRVTQADTADFVVYCQPIWREVAKGQTYYAFLSANVQVRYQGLVRTSFTQKAKGVSGLASLAKDKAVEKLLLNFSTQLSTNLLDSFTPGQPSK